MASDTSTQSLFGRLSARSSFVSNKEIKINIQLLDDNETISHEFKRSANAQTILDYVCECTGIQEKDYFGLRVLDASKHRYWVDLTKPISHILKYQNKADHLALRLRFRFYPADPKNLKEEITRYQLLVQLQRDLLHGRLHCQSTLAAQLAAFALQSQLGDYDPSKHPDGYVSEYKLLLKQTPKIEERIAECHKALRGVSASNAELQFLEKASALDTYGFDPYTVKEAKDQSRTVYLGVTHKGVLVFYTNQKAHHIPWTQLSKVDYIGKEIRITPSDDYLPPADISELNFSRDSTLNATANGETKKVTKRDKKMKLVYLCPTGTFAKHLWIHILSQQAFFTEAKATEVKQKFSKARIPLLTRGTTFRYTPPRVAKELENDSAESDGESLLRSQRSFTRYSLTRQAPRGEQPWLNKYHTLPNLHKTSNANGGLVSSPQNQSIREEEAQPEENKAVSTSCLDSSIISNISAPFEASETSSQSRASSPLTRENMTQITIHLRKVEEKAKSAVTADRASSPLRPIGEEEVKRTTRLVESQPLMTSTPLASKNHEESNGRLLNKEDEGEEATKVTTSQRIVNVVFATFLVTLLIVALLIALFENSSSLEWEQRVPALSTVRHAIYEPARHFALSRYQKYLSR